MKLKYEDNTMILFLEGRIDSVGAPETEKEINAEIDGKEIDSLVLDLDKLEYISSAGLRVILRLLKKHPSLKAVNASTEVYEIFEMTGFTEMMTVEKAFRRVSVEGCEVIGRGANGEVYRLDPETIVKVYLNPDSLEDIRRERELARKAFVMGIPTAIPYDVVRVGDGYGSVFELLSADSFAKLISREPEKFDEYIRLYIDLAKKMHSTGIKPGDLPDAKDEALAHCEALKGLLPDDMTERITALISAVPAGHTLMHGDYHIKNVMMQDGEVLLIDMDTLCVGNPVFELSSMYLAYVGFGELDPENIENFLGIPIATANGIWDKCLEYYFEGESAEAIRAAEDKARIIAYANLVRYAARSAAKNPELSAKKAEYYKEQLAALLARTDSLAY